jgi:hypothetical protein
MLRHHIAGHQESNQVEGPHIGLSTKAPEALEALLAAGADVSLPDATGQVRSSLFSSGHDGATLNPAAVVDRHQTALHMACRANLMGAITLLVSHPGVDVNAVEGHTGMTPLMLALRNAQPKPAVRGDGVG